MPSTNTPGGYNYTHLQTYNQLSDSNASLNASFPTSGKPEFTRSVVQTFQAPSHSHSDLMSGLPGNTHSTRVFTGELQSHATEGGPPRPGRSTRISSQGESAAGTQTSSTITHTNHPIRRDTARQVIIGLSICLVFSNSWLPQQSRVPILPSKAPIFMPLLPLRRSVWLSQRPRTPQGHT
jgi:hypothetical protein